MSSKRSAGRMSTSTCASSLADVPPVVDDSRRDLDLLPRRGDLVAAIEMEADGAGHHLEALGDVGVHMLAGDGPTRPDVEITHQALAAGVLAPLAHQETVALDPVLVDLARSQDKLLVRLSNDLARSSNYLAVPSSARAPAAVPSPPELARHSQLRHPLARPGAGHQRVGERRSRRARVR